MSKFVLSGGTPLRGAVRVPGAKNAVLPIIAAALLCDQEVEVDDCPDLSDVHNMLAIMERIGCRCRLQGGALTIDASSAHGWEMPEALGKELRSSIFMLGPVLARFHKARCPYPGGCEIGLRPINLHLKGLRAFNVGIREELGYIVCDGANMRPANILLDAPSVGATENLMMAAVGIDGVSTIQNAACEPEITDLAKLLNAMGARITGAGSPTIAVDGGHELHGVRHTLLSDRIVAGTYMVAAAITAGDLSIENVRPDHLESVLACLKEAGCTIDIEGTAGEPCRVRVRGPLRPRELHHIETQPHPGFPTDMQAQFFALACVAEGTSVITENVFENRFKHASELSCMGASIVLKDRTAVIRGVQTLTGAQVNARDLRGGAALTLAGLRARGESVIHGVEYIDRGYECLDKTLSSLGATIRRLA